MRQKDLRRKTHETINKVNDDYGRRNTFNTAIAAVMELLNEVAKLNDNEAKSIAVRHEALTSAILLLSPIAPHICHSLWKTMGNRRRYRRCSHGQYWMSRRWCAAPSRW